MKVIDLLNKIANDEAPKEIKAHNKIYKWEENLSLYICGGGQLCFDYFVENNKLNDEVEIIEEDKKIRKLDFIEENTFSKRQNRMTNEDRRLLDSNFKELGNKINEIIDCINKEK